MTYLNYLSDPFKKVAGFNKQLYWGNTPLLSVFHVTLVLLLIMQSQPAYF